MIIKGSRAGSVLCTNGSGSVAGSIPCTNGSGAGSGEAKNVRIRIRNKFLIVCLLSKGPVRGQGADEAREQAAALLQGPHEEVGRRAQAQQAVHQEGPGGLPDRTREQVQEHPQSVKYKYIHSLKYSVIDPQSVGQNKRSAVKESTCLATSWIGFLFPNFQLFLLILGFNF